MLFYFAPIKGITNYIYRNTYQSSFNGVDKFFTPFLEANNVGGFAKKSLADMNRDNNDKVCLTPQVLANNADTFSILAKKLKNQGYNEININMGCPSGTVTSKKRGSGQLRDLDALRSFLDEIFINPIVDISIKTRIGFAFSSEMENILPVFNDYPLKELIVHPRVREDYYKGDINLEVFKTIFEQSKNKVCYNGDLFTVEKIKHFTNNFPQVDRIMLGRGLIANPGLIEQFKTGKKMSIEEFKDHHDSLYLQYSTLLFGEKHLLNKMKEHWIIWRMSFLNNEKEVKKILKTLSINSYLKYVDKVFNDDDMTI